MARQFIPVLGAVALLAGAGLAALVGWTVSWLACENQGTPACARQELASVQFALALVGLIPAFVLVFGVFFRKRRLAVAAVVVAIPLYLAWALFLDAAVHGWDDLTLLP